MTTKLVRCWNVDKPLYLKYHDYEWGVPVHDDQRLFEFLVLDGFQAGLSWWLILERREAFRAAYGLTPKNKYTAKDASVNERPVVKNRAKISDHNKCTAISKGQKEFGSFDNSSGSL
jgi:DNA-3-methyladenine glycosylase I